MCICQMYMLSGDCSPGFMSPEGIYIRQYYLHSGICTGTRCNYLRTRYFWRRLTINYLQLAQVRKSMSLRRLKNRRSPKICLWVACKAVFAKPAVPGFLHRGRAASATDKLCHTRHFCHTCQFCHFSFSVIGGRPGGRWGVGGGVAGGGGWCGCMIHHEFCRSGQKSRMEKTVVKS